MVGLEEIIDKYSLSIEKIIHRTYSKIVYLLVNKNGKRFVLKMYKRNSAKLKTEQQFLSRVNHVNYRYIRFPRLVEFGNNYVLVDYVEREHFTRDTIVDREWSADDVKLWVSGLIEFQRIEIPSNDFSFKQRVMGIIFPVCRILILLPKCRESIDLKAFGVIFKMALCYSLSRPFFRNVLTHYDLQTYNYTFMKNERKMSILDFELPRYRGDPLFDVLYYLSIPIMKLKDWTFQAAILTEYIKQVYGGAWDSKSLLSRIRLILLVRNLSRYLGFINDTNKKMTYSENVRLLLNGESFYGWVSSILNLQSTCLEGSS